MRIVHSDDDRLIIHDRPWLAWIIVGILFLGSSHAIFFDENIETWERFFIAAIVAGMVWVAWWGLPGVNLRFDHEGLSFVEYRITGAFTREYPLEQIRGIQTETNRHASGEPHRLVLETTGGDLPLERGFGPYDRREIAGAISEWLDQAQMRLTDQSEIC